MKILKKISLLCVFILCLGIMASCSNSTKQNSVKVSMSASSIYDEFLKQEVSVDLEKFTDDIAETFLDAKVSDFADVAIYSSPLNVRSSEIGIFKYDNETQKANINKAITKRMEDLEEIWSKYLPDQYEFVKNHLRFESENVIAYIIDENASKIYSKLSSLTTPK